ncbi:unnamed protein product [Oppiella nova]|uniref:Uncharacterized protein n=1 Tax=Oppiella nova TaxID=334625 RepID=A0A7R9ML68_9ACAR|nr:unnamed protein product [Oppiella nova]CAG2179095.1 unnamed protein product [Oppiella nova]
MYRNKKYAKLVIYMETCYSGDCFEKPWLDDLDSKNDPDETLQQQYEYIYKTSSVVREKIRLEYNVSVPLPEYPVQFGDLRIAKLKVSQFFSN